MAKVHITNVVVLDNPSSFLNPFQFELTFECIEELKEDLEWKMIYVGSAESEAFDQVLDPTQRYLFRPPKRSRMVLRIFCVTFLHTKKQARHNYMYM